MANAPGTTLSRTHDQPLRRKIAAILAADVAGYSRLVAEAEEDTLRQLAASREIFDAHVVQAGGRIFNTAGDSVMCEFDSAVEAVRAAIDIQESLASRNRDIPTARQLRFRMGLTIGDVVERDGDLLGDGVNIASRLESLSPPGGICVSRSVHEAVANKIEVVFRDLGQRTVKNIPQPIHAFVIAPPREEAPPVEIAPEPVAPRRAAVPAAAPRRAGYLVVGAALLVGAAAWPGLTLLRNSVEGPSRETIGRENTARENTVREGAAKDKIARESAARPPSNLAATEPAAPPQAPAAATSPPASAGKPAAMPAATAPVAGSPAAAPPAAIVVGPSAVPKPVARPAKPAERTLPADPVAALAALSKEGILADPTGIAELYHNGRLQESKDRPAALRSYAALTAKSAEFLDADLRYAALLRAANGVAAARTAFADLVRTNPGLAPALVAATLAEPAERRERLEALAADDPDFAPTSYFLAEDYLGERPGGATITERRLAFDALDAFLDSSNSAKTGAAFLDRTVLTAWREAAQKRRAEIEAAFAGLKTRPTAAFARAENAWTVSLALPEPAIGIAYRLGEGGDFRTTGQGAGTDARTGRPVARTQFELPPNAGRGTLYVTYTDVSGHAAGPFPITFDPVAALIASERETLERFPESWVTFRPDIPDVVSVAQLVSNRCAITRALIGFGDEPPRAQLPLPACNDQSPYAIPSNARLVLNVPADLETVQVQLSYADGTESQVRTFRRP